jgi:hypothetical protein
MEAVWQCVLRVVPKLLAEEACEAYDGSTRKIARKRKAAAAALRALAAVSVESRLAVARACAGLAALATTDRVLAPHVELSLRTVSAYSAALCLLCGKRVHVPRARLTCAFRMHPTCVHKNRAMFAPLRTVVLGKGHTKLPFLVADAFAYRKFRCVLLDRTWRFKRTATPTAFADRVARRAANGVRNASRL